MARRLAKEWEIEDSARLDDNHQPPASTSMLSPRRTKRRAKRLVVQSRSGSASDPIAIDDGDDITIPNEKLPPVAQLEECRALFTGDKTCSSCSAKLPSPRGHVNKLIFSKTHILRPSDPASRSRSPHTQAHPQVSSASFTYHASPVRQTTAEAAWRPSPALPPAKATIPNAQCRHAAPVCAS